MKIFVELENGMVIKDIFKRRPKEEIMELIAKIKREIPEATLRTSLIVGFPDEREEDFNELESSAEQEYVNYVRPQEHGNHNKTKMLKIGNMVFEAENSFEFNVSYFLFHNFSFQNIPILLVVLIIS